MDPIPGFIPINPPLSHSQQQFSVDGGRFPRSGSSHSLCCLKIDEPGLLPLVEFSSGRGRPEVPFGFAAPDENWVMAIICLWILLP